MQKIQTTTKKKDKLKVSASPRSFSTGIHYTPKILLHLVAKYDNLGDSEEEINCIKYNQLIKCCHTCVLYVFVVQKKQTGKGK